MSAVSGVLDTPVFDTPVVDTPVVDMPIEVPGAEVVEPSSGSKPFSWYEPHVKFVIIVVGPDKTPYSMQWDMLVAKSSYFREVLSKRDLDELETTVRLPDIPKEVFGIAQQFMYQGTVYAEGCEIPPYEILVSVWNISVRLGIEGLGQKIVEAMKELYRLTKRIPATPLLVQVWKDTPKGSPVRALLLDWTSDYMRVSNLTETFATSLPHEVLTDLVVKMAKDPIFEAGGAPPPPCPSFPLPPSPGSTTGASAHRNIHYLSDDSDEEAGNQASKRTKRGPTANQPAAPEKPVRRLSAMEPKERAKPGPKPGNRKVYRRKSNNIITDSRTFSTNQKLNFCHDLITRMVSGPGFWTRLVGPFKQPVNPKEDGVPDYLEKVTNPMDLSTIKSKMDSKQYSHEDVFLEDMRQIFKNAYLYWKPGDPIYIACQNLERTFEDKFSQMSKWIIKMEPPED